MDVKNRISGDIRQPHHHDSAAKHVSGKAVYVDDIAMPAHGLVVLIGQSPHAHAEITSMDLSEVSAAPGVVAVLSASDIPGVNDCGPVIHDDPIFAENIVCYVGQSVFAVVAVDMASARAALPLAKIEYAPRPAILTIDDAMVAKSFLGPPATMVKGTPAEAMAAAARRLSGRLRIGEIGRAHV